MAKIFFSDEFSHQTDALRARLRTEIERAARSGFDEADKNIVLSNDNVDFSVSVRIFVSRLIIVGDIGYSLEIESSVPSVVTQWINWRGSKSLIHHPFIFESPFNSGQYVNVHSGENSGLMCKGTNWRGASNFEWTTIDVYLGKEYEKITDDINELVHLCTLYLLDPNISSVNIKDVSYDIVMGKF